MSSSDIDPNSEVPFGPLNPQGPQVSQGPTDPQGAATIGPLDDSETVVAITKALRNGDKVDVPEVLQSRVSILMSRLQREESDKQLEMLSFQRALRTDHELAGEAQRLGIDTGLDPRTVEANIEKARELKKRMDLEALQLAGNSEILAQMFTDPEFAGVAGDQLNELGFIEKTFAFASQGYLRSRQGVIWDRIRQGTATMADRAEAIELEKRLWELPEDSSGQGIFGGLWYGTWSTLGQMTEAVPEAFGWGAAMAGVALAAGQSGPQVALPEEILSVPTMFWAGFRAGMFGHTAAVEAGQSYKTMRSMGVSHEIASQSSWWVGAVNGAFETAGFGVLTKLARKEIAQAVTRQVAKDLLLKPTVTAAAKRFALDTLKATSGEVLTEVMQEVTGIIGEQIAVAKQMGVDPVAVNWQNVEANSDYVDRIAGIIAETIRGSLLIGSFGPMLRIRRDVARIREAKGTGEFLQNLQKGIDGTTVTKRAPNQLQKFLRALSEGSPVENIYFKPEEFAQALEQAKITPDQLTKIAPDVAKAFAEGQATGVMEIPVDSWGARFMSSEFGKALAQDARVDPDGVSIREVREVAAQDQKAIVEEAEKILSEKEKSDKAFVEEVKLVREDMKSQLLAANPKITPEEAATEAQLYGHFATVYSQHEKMSPVEWHETHGLRFISADKAPAIGRALSQDGEQPFVPTEGKANEEAMRTLMLPPGEVPTIGAEKGKLKQNGISKLTSKQGSTRYVSAVDGKPVAVVQVVTKPDGTAVVSNAYTAPEARRQGHAEKLMRQALAENPSATPAGMTAEGAALMNKVTGRLPSLNQDELQQDAEDPTADAEDPTATGGSISGGAVPAAIPPWLVSKVDIKITPKQKKAAAKAKPKARMAEENYKRIDAVFAQVPNPLESEDSWNKFMALLTGKDVVLAAPLQAIKYANDPQLIADYLKRMRSDQLESRREGFILGRQIRELYRTKKATPILTGRILMWGMLSRSAGAFPHESAFMDLVRAGVDQWIARALGGEWTDADTDAYVEWSQLYMGSLKGGLSPATQVTSNANDFGRLLLTKMSKVVDGKSGLARLHEMLMSNATTSEIRRFFFTIGDGLGIQNKVVSFALLVTGRTDTLVLDRVQLTHFWGPEYQDRALKAGVKKSPTGVVNIYDPPRGAHGRTGLAPAGEGHIGIAIYEALDRGLRDAVRKGYDLAGLVDEGDGDLGAWHWDSWLVQSSQAIAHPTIEALVTEQPRRDLAVRQGKFDTYSYGTRYRSDGRYEVPMLTRTGFVLMDPPAYNDFLGRIADPSEGVVPDGFLVSSHKASPWVDAPEVNRARYDELALAGGPAVGAAAQSSTPLRSRPVADRAASPVRAGDGGQSEGSPPLVAIHNLTLANLRFADEIGGLPVPSIGVVTNRTGEIPEFGDITLIGSREMVDPSNGVPVFSGDAWTTRFPDPVYDVQRSSFKKFTGPILDWGQKVGLRGGVLWSIYGEAAASMKPQKTKWELLRDDTVRAWFLSNELGVELQFPKESYNPNWSILRVDEDTRTALMGSPDYYVYSQGDWQDVTKVTDGLAKILYDAAEKKLAADPDLLDVLRTTFLDENGVLEGWRVMKEWESVRQQMSMSDNGTLDERAFGKFLDQQFTKDRQAKFATWVDKQVDELYGEPFLGSKRKRIAWTLDNIVREMSKTKVRNKEKSMTFGAGKAIAAVAKEFKSLQEIRDSSPKIAEDSKIYSEQRKKVEDKLSDYREVATSFWGGDTWDGLDASMRALSRALKSAKTPTLAGMLKALQSEGFFIPDGLSTRFEQMTADDVARSEGGTSRSIKFLEQARDAALALRDLPVPYFEAKPMRAVKLSEFKSAVVPHDIDPVAEEILARHGVPIERYRSDIYAGPLSRVQTVRRVASEREAMFAPTGRGRFYERMRLAVLEKDADPSTVIHEMSHFFFTTMVRVASKEGAPRQVVEDVETILRWFAESGKLDIDAGGFDAIQQWNALSFEQQERFHEQLAYSFELYVFEGKAPAPKLEGLYARMRTWMIRVYRDIRDTLNRLYKEKFGDDLPVMSPEVKLVFDRMLASQETIEQAEAMRRMLPLYQDRESFLAAGFSEDQWDEYQKVLEEAHAAAVTDMTRASLSQLRWLKNARSRVLKQLQKENAKARATVEEAIRAELKQERVYMALDLLREASGDSKLSLDQVREKLAGLDEKARAAAEKKLGTGKRGALAKKGADIEVMAQLFGYESADMMLREMVAARPIDAEVEARTDAEMLKTHGEITDPERMEVAIEKALHNEARARFVAVEQGFLSKSGKPARVMVASARFAAQRLLEERTVRSLRPDRYAQAEARAARDAERASRSKPATRDNERRTGGDLSEAVRAKARQLLNNQLVAESIKAREEVGRAREFAKRFNRSNEKLAKAGFDVNIVNIGRWILARTGMLAESMVDRTVDYMEMLERYDPVLFEEYKPWLARFAQGAFDYRDLSLGEFRAMTDAVKTLWARAKMANEVKVGNSRMAVQEAVRKLHEQIAGRIPDNVAGTAKALTKSDKAARMLLGTKGNLTRVEHLFRAFDGGEHGVFSTLLFDEISQALDRYRAQATVYTKKLVELVRQLPLNMTSIDATKEFGYTFKNDAELVGLLLHMGNKSNREKVLIGGRGDGKSWGDFDANGEVDISRWLELRDRLIQEGRLKKEHFAFAQAVWDMMEQIKPTLQEAHLYLEGYYFKEVQAESFTIEWPDGTTETYAGGYVPAAADADLMGTAQDPATLASLHDDFRQEIPKVQFGNVKERIDNYRKRPLSIDIRMIAQHIDKAMRFAHVQPRLRDAVKILSGSFEDQDGNRVELSAALNRIHPNLVKGVLMPWLDRAATQTLYKPGGDGLWNAIGKFVRRNTGVAIMMLNPVNALQQLTGITNSLVYVKSGYLVGGLKRYMSERDKLVEFITERSEFMEERLASQTHSLRTDLHEMLLNPSSWSQMQAWTTDKAYALQAIVQNQVDIVTWTGAFDQAMATMKPGENVEQQEARAVAEANSAVRLAQGSFSPEDVANYEVGSPWQRAWTQFTGFFNNVLNTIGYSDNKVRAAVLSFSLPMIASEAIAKVLWGQWESDDPDQDEWLLDGWVWDGLDVFILSQLRGSAAFLPAVGPAAVGVLDQAFSDRQFGDRVAASPPLVALTRSVTGLLTASRAVVDSERDLTGRTARDALTAITVLTGAPLAPLARPVAYGLDWARGKIEPTSPFDAARGLITGRASTGSKQ